MSQTCDLIHASYATPVISVLSSVLPTLLLSSVETKTLFPVIAECEKQAIFCAMWRLRVVVRWLSSIIRWPPYGNILAKKHLIASDAVWRR
jgi:hypothetical protein